MTNEPAKNNNEHLKMAAELLQNIENSKQPMAVFLRKCGDDLLEQDQDKTSWQNTLKLEILQNEIDVKIKKQNELSSFDVSLMPDWQKERYYKILTDEIYFSLIELMKLIFKDKPELDAMTEWAKSGIDMDKLRITLFEMMEKDNEPKQ